jgi:pseudouridine kinase
MRFTVIGGMNLDALGIPLHGFCVRDSNIGRIVFSAGGVGRNIAGCLARLGGEVNLITAVCRDNNARFLRHSCKISGISLAGSLVADIPSSVYLCVHDEKGDMLAAVNDMRIMDLLTPRHMARRMPVINRSDVCVLDANVPADTLAFVAAHAHVPLLLDPVSCAKSERALSVLSGIHAIKPNLREAKAMSGQNTPEDAAAWFLGKGVRRVFISMGAAGVYYADAGVRGVNPAISVPRCPQTGAGDAMCAGIAMALACGLDTPACAREGSRCASEYLELAATEENHA